ncbi:hypothetical protein HDU80_006855 [Chytriomyces hyalinus]|nr:hypothetical protein HDU80_006855 [Chytriomyces hyalinus]
MSSDHTASNGVPSLADSCIAKMQRNVDQIYSLNTNLGDVPAHLFLRILPKAMTFVQLERLIEYNPHMEDSLSADLSGYYRLIALREFASLRKAIESSDFEEPDNWRHAYLDMKKERDERLLRVEQHPATVKSTSSNSKPTPLKKLATDAAASSASSKPKVSRNGQFLVAPPFRPTGL